MTRFQASLTQRCKIEEVYSPTVGLNLLAGLPKSINLLWRDLKTSPMRCLKYSQGISGGFTPSASSKSCESGHFPFCFLFFFFLSHASTLTPPPLFPLTLLSSSLSSACIQMGLFSSAERDTDTRSGDTHAYAHTHTHTRGQADIE